MKAKEENIILSEVIITAPNIAPIISTNIAPKEIEALRLTPHIVIIVIPTIISPKPSGWNVSANIWNNTGTGRKK